jgi:hypothetical protein
MACPWSMILLYAIKQVMPLEGVSLLQNQDLGEVLHYSMPLDRLYPQEGISLDRFDQ